MADASIYVKVLQNAIYMFGTIAALRTLPVRASNTVDGTRMFFHRLFWKFPPCVEAFKYCKPLISIDGTHLYGKYGGTLLMAIAQDGNSNILPVAALVVEDSGWLPLTAHCALCARHIAANFVLNFKSKDAQKILVNATYAKAE
ncbi:uncharacterized protein [Arachis hypogaea]|uniref:uncharacterized protein n=1 Tax=Arachis hypogaea TaxID=3818 RepID=UPI000DEC38DA|nr:uncharacterized protein LOC112757842 [Arachis hypogaea]